jgi:hypothetical protein
VVGAVVGRDESCIRTGLAHTFSRTNNDAFLRRLLSLDMPVQGAMILLRQCMVPQLNYLLRCSPPSCIGDIANEFSCSVLDTAKEKLDIAEHELTPDAIRILRAQLKDGGFGLTSACHTSAGAYLGSLAAARTATVFAPYTSNAQPLPSDSLLHNWIVDSMRRVVEATPTATEHLPPSASSFFSHYTQAKSSLSNSLQRTVNSLANQHRYDASMTHARASRKQDGGHALAHLLAISAPFASAWKSALPVTVATTLSDAQYRVAARLNLRLNPLRDMSELSDHCRVCGKENALINDRWHFLACRKQMGPDGELSARHNAVNDALYMSVLTLGGQAVREPSGMSDQNNRRPDLQMIFPGHHLLTDVIVTRCNISDLDPFESLVREVLREVRAVGTGA